MKQLPSSYTLGRLNDIFDVAAYCVVADESVGRQVPMTFLERIKEDFLSRYGGGKAATVPANSLNKEFGYSIVTMIIGIHAGSLIFFF